MNNMPPQLKLELTLEQQFQQRKYEEAAKTMTPEQLRKELLGATRLLMLKDNVIKSLIKGGGNGG